MKHRESLQRTTTLHRLRPHQALSLHRPRGVCVRAERGNLWVTVDGEPADIQLRPGDSCIFDSQATVVIGAVGGSAVVSTTRQGPPSWPQRLQSALAGVWSQVPA